MGQRPNCRSCRHCQPPQVGEAGWCRLRRLPIHPDLATELWCHHWTARPPRLPGAEAVVVPLHPPADRQLALTDLLVAGG